MSTFAPMARATSLQRVASASGILMKPIFVHPAHFELDAEPTASSSYMGSAASSFCSSSSSLLFEDEDQLARVGQQLSLVDSTPSSPSSSLASLESPNDFFSEAFSRGHRGSDAESYFTMDTSPGSSNSSTPTCESPMTSSKSPMMARTFSFGAEECKENFAAPTSAAIDFPASFSFTTFTKPTTSPASPPRNSPYARRASTTTTGGSMMMRAVSSPVETQRELDNRRRRQQDASEVMHDSATKMVRRRSMAAVAMTRAPSSSMMARGPSSNFSLLAQTLAAAPSSPVVASEPVPSSPLVSPFGEGWGSALPPSESAFPFPSRGVASSNVPCRLNRSYSTTYVEDFHHVASVATSSLHQHRNSVPNTSSSSSSALSSQSNLDFNAASLAPPMVRPRRATLGLAPLTPIIPSAPLAGEDIESFANAINSMPLMMPGRLIRGTTYS